MASYKKGQRVIFRGGFEIYARISLTGVEGIVTDDQVGEGVHVKIVHPGNGYPWHVYIGQEAISHTEEFLYGF